MDFRTCPFCGKNHTWRPLLNIICPCGAKRYFNSGKWLNRKQGN